MVPVPDVGVASPRIMRRVVVLPAPLGPRNPVTDPGSTVNDNPSTALIVTEDLGEAGGDDATIDARWCALKRARAQMRVRPLPERQKRRPQCLVRSA